MNTAIGFLMTHMEEFVNSLNHAKVSVLSFAPNVFLENQVVNRGFAVLQEYVRVETYLPIILNKPNINVRLIAALNQAACGFLIMKWTKFAYYLKLVQELMEI